MKKNILIALFLTLSFILPHFCFGIGQMTELMLIENVLRGQSAQGEMLITGSSQKEEIYELKTEGEIKDWARFYEIDNLENSIQEVIVPIREVVRVLVVFTIPEDIPNGAYHGELMVIESPKRQEEEGVSFGVGASVSREVLITVTDQEIIDFETAVIPLKYAIGKGDTLKIKLIYNNKGNVQISPSVALRIIKDDTAVFNAIYPYPETEQPVKPLERKALEYIEWPSAGQPNGTYKAELKISLADELMSEHSFRFDVGRDISWYLAALANLGPGKLGIILIAIGIILLAIFAVRTFVFKKKDWMTLASFVKGIFS